MRILLAAAVTAAITLILAGCVAQAPEPKISAGPLVTAPAEPADAASSVSLLEREPALEPHLFARECFMAAAYKRYQIPAAALDHAYATANGLEAYFVDVVYVTTDQRCPATEAARTAQSTPRLQATQ
jgi:hypothetical protein